MKGIYQHIDERVEEIIQEKLDQKLGEALQLRDTKIIDLMKQVDSLSSELKQVKKDFNHKLEKRVDEAVSKAI